MLILGLFDHNLEVLAGAWPYQPIKSGWACNEVLDPIQAPNLVSVVWEFLVERLPRQEVHTMP